MVSILNGVTGTVTRVSQGSNFTANNKSCVNYSFQVDEKDVWYKVPFLEVSEVPEAPSKGDQVSFIFDVKTRGQYTNNIVDRTSLKISKPQVGSSASAPSRANNNEGVQIGHALNCAVAALGPIGKTSPDTYVSKLGDLAVKVLALSVEMNKTGVEKLISGSPTPSASSDIADDDIPF